jgi:hypothetical protein
VFVVVDVVGAVEGPSVAVLAGTEQYRNVSNG